MRRHFRGAVEPLEDRRLLASTIQLVGFYDFEGDVEDSSGNNLHGTVIGSGTSFGPGYNGQGLVFDGGDNDAVTVPINISPDMTPAVTIAAWVNVTGLNGLGDGIHTIVQSDGDFARKILISDQSAAADATPETTYYTAFTGRDFENKFPFPNPNQPAPAVKPVVPGNDGWVFLAASYNGYNRSVQILAGDQSFVEPLAYPNQASQYSYLNIGGLRAANGQFFEELIGTIDNVFVINGAASLAQLESIRDAVDPFAQVQTVVAEMRAAGPTRTFKIDFSDAGTNGGTAVLASGIIGTETWNDFQESGNRLVGPALLSDTEGNPTSVSVDFSSVFVSDGWNYGGRNSHAQAGQDGFYRFNATDTTFRFRGLDPTATYRLTGIGSWNFNEFAEIKVDTDGDGTVDTYEVVRPYSGAIRSIGPGGTQDVAIVPAADGSLVAAFGDAFDNGNTESIAGLILEEFGTVPDTLQVVRLEPTASGFVVDFNRAIDPDVLNLYDVESSALGPADVTLVGDTTGPVAGSLVVAGERLTFVATGGPLPADTYTVALRSADNGIRDLNGELLDGDEDGTPGTDYVAPLTITAPEDVVISLPDFARGPRQPVDVPANDPGLPLMLDDSRTVGAGITSVTLTIDYDPQLLTVASAVPGADAPAGAVVSADTNTPGRVVVSYDSAAPLAHGAHQFVNLISSVPGGATYEAAHVLDVSGVTVNNGGVPATADDALHVVAYLGDATGDGTYSGLDAQRVARIGVGLDGGLEDYPVIDPVIVADATSNGDLSALDAQRIAQEAVGLDTDEIPPIEPPPGPALPGVGPARHVQEDAEYIDVALVGLYNDRISGDDVLGFVRPDVPSLAAAIRARGTFLLPVQTAIDRVEADRADRVFAEFEIRSWESVDPPGDRRDGTNELLTALMQELAHDFG